MKKLYDALIISLVVCVRESVPIHSTPVCGIHLH